MSDPGDGFDLDALDEEHLPEELLGALTDPIARYAVHYLHQGGRATLVELADVVTGWLAATDGRIATPADRDRVCVLLYHQHLPKLASTALFRFDVDRRTIAMTDTSPAVESLLEWLERVDRSDDGDDVR